MMKKTMSKFIKVYDALNIRFRVRLIQKDEWRVNLL